jgi:hypothetical protein
MTQDDETPDNKSQRRVSGYRGVVMIVLGLVVAIRYLSSDDASWAPIVLLGVCIAGAAYFLFDASRD